MARDQELTDISAEDIMQCGLAFWAVGAVELDLFTELAAARLQTHARAPHEPQQACRTHGADRSKGLG